VDTNEEQSNMTKKQKHPEFIYEKVILVGPRPFPWKILKNYLLGPHISLIFIDGGAVHLKKFKEKAPHLLKNCLFMGDGDSSKVIMNIKKTSQNSSDLAFVLSKLSGKLRPRTCLFAGFLGGRIDHQLFNLGEMAHYLKKFTQNNAPLFQIDDKILFVGSGVYTLKIHGPFSVASFGPNKIKISGDCDFKSNSWLKIPTLSSRGLSNMGFGEIKIETQTPLAIIRP
jgi:thiamine pyrophosphokinase